MKRISGFVLYQLRRTWERRGTLYTHAAVHALAAGVRTDLEEWGHRAPELAPLRGAPPAVPVEHHDYTPESQQAAYLYPIASDDHEWRCVECGARFDRGLGCVQCVEPVCRACVRAELHVCADRRACGEDGATLQRIAEAIGPDRDDPRSVVAWSMKSRERRTKGLTKERVRQLEVRALARLRLPLREKGIACAS